MTNLIDCNICHAITATKREFKHGDILTCPYCGAEIQIRVTNTNRNIVITYIGYPKDAP